MDGYLFAHESIKSLLQLFAWYFTVVREVVKVYDVVGPIFLVNDDIDPV